MNEGFSVQDDLTNCELSMEELEAIAAGWPSWMRAIGRGVETVAKDVAKVAVGAGLVAFAAITAYSVAYTIHNYDDLKVK